MDKINKEFNTKFLMRVASYMAINGILDITYLELQEIMEQLEKENNPAQEKKA